MNTKILMAFLVVSICSLTKPQAQLRISFNVGLQPVWGPVGYERADNYYLPDIETYYNVQNRQYTYQINGSWVTTYTLPPNHRDYDLYAGHKVVINGSKPYLRHDIYRDRYSNFRNRHDQSVIRDSRDNRYFENKDHPRHGEWKENGHDNRDKNHGDRGDDYKDRGGHGDHGRQDDHGDRKDNGRNDR